MGSPKTRPGRVRMHGPLVPFIAEFRARLKDAGYTPLSAAVQERFMAHLSGWLESQQLGTLDLTDARIDEYLVTRRAQGHQWPASRRALVPLLDVLASHHALPAPAAVTASPVDAVLASFRGYLLEERGLAPSTACAYTARASRFLGGCAADGDLSTLTPGDVTRAVLAESTSVSVGSVQYFVAGLRSFLRFCHLEGLVEADLSAAALAITGRRRSSLPRGISKTDADALLRSCDRRRAVGRRDHAILLTLLRLGLRASELAGLTLGDIDWRAAEIVVHGKGRRDERLPLPADVGHAVAGYLRRGRPKTKRREVFVSALAPVGPIGRGGVSSLVRRACLRAGLTPVGAHRLRHTLACEMVAAGVPLPEIAQVLRHRGVSSTAIYARVDLQQLRGVARPWPGGACS